MRAKRAILSILIILASVGLALLFVNECAYGGGMGAAYTSCDCLGIELELYDRRAADGPRKTLCLGIVRSRECYAYIGGPQVVCDRGPRVTAKTDKQVYEAGEEIAVAIENRLPEPIRYDGLCSLSLCHVLEGAWFCEMKECHGPAMVLEAGSSQLAAMQAGGLAGAKLRYRLDYRVHSGNTLYTTYTNEFTIGAGNAADAGYSFYARQIIPGEAWLEDGTSRYFESPTTPERVRLRDNTLSLEVRVGHKGAQTVTREIRFTVVLLGEGAVRVDCPETNIRVELDDPIERAVNNTIRAYEPVTVPKHQWVEVLSESSHNAPKWQLWWGEPPGSP